MTYSPAENAAYDAEARWTKPARRPTIVLDVPHLFGTPDEQSGPREDAELRELVRTVPELKAAGATATVITAWVGIREAAIARAGDRTAELTDTVRGLVDQLDGLDADAPADAYRRLVRLLRGAQARLDEQLDRR